MRSRCFWLGLALSLGLGGCGFQLADSKGTVTRFPDLSLQLVGGTPGFLPELWGGLRASGARQASDNEEADLIVHLDGPSERQRVIGVTPDMDAREYEINMRLTVRLQKPGAKLSEPVTLSRYRHWLFDTDMYLGADEERELLRKEMRTELIEDLRLYLWADAEKQSDSATDI